MLTLVQNLFSELRATVESIKPKVGTSALLQGFEFFSIENIATIQQYVSRVMLARRVTLVSQALSASFTAFRCSIAAIRCSRLVVFIVFCKNILYGLVGATGLTSSSLYTCLSADRNFSSVYLPLVGATGLEPATTRPPAVYSSQLNYAPLITV